LLDLLRKDINILLLLYDPCLLLPKHEQNLLALPEQIIHQILSIIV